MNLLRVKNGGPLKLYETVGGHCGLGSLVVEQMCIFVHFVGLNFPLFSLLVD